MSADTSKPLFSREVPKFQTAFFLTTFTVKAKNRKSPQTFPVFEYKNNSAEHGQSETEAILNKKSNQDADEPGTALIDDPFQRFLQAGAGLLGKRLTAPAHHPKSEQEMWILPTSLLLPLVDQQKWTLHRQQ